MVSEKSRSEKLLGTQSSSLSSFLSTKKETPLSVAIFDQNKSVRFFRFPKDWLASLGAAIAIIVVILLTLVFVVFHLGIKLKNTSPEHINQSMGELESKVSQLTSENSDLKEKINNSKNSGVAMLPSQDLAAMPTAIDPEPSDIPENTVPALGKSSGLYNVFTVAQSGPLPVVDSLAIRITKPIINWRGGLLRARFFIQYVKGDKGNQQGRVIVFARGGTNILGYPDNVFQSIDSGAFIDIHEGETFSVGRIREVNAEFENVAYRSDLKQLQVMIFNMSDQLILSETLPIPELWGQNKISQNQKSGNSSAPSVNTPLDSSGKNIGNGISTDAQQTKE